MKKTYWACVEGRPDPPAGTWQDYLIKVYGRPQAEVVPPDHPDGRPAVLHYRTLALADVGRLAGDRAGDRPDAPNPHSGRFAEAIRCVGDFQYGAKTPFGPQYDDERLRAIALHARTLEFEHPTSRQRDFRHRAGTALAGYPIACSP